MTNVRFNINITSWRGGGEGGSTNKVSIKGFYEMGISGVKLFHSLVDTCAKFQDNVSKFLWSNTLVCDAEP